MQRVLAAAEMQALDRDASAACGIPSLLLMENAGAETCRALVTEFPVLARGVLVLAGRGNNGGDGFVVARRLLARGIPAQVWLAGSAEDVKGDAGTNLKILQMMGAPLHVLTAGQSLAPVERAIASVDVVLDALLGTGTQGGARGLSAELIDLTNRATTPVVSVDLPSGLCADEPLPPGPAVRAQLTVTFAFPKPCLVLPPACQYAGRLVVVDIGIPRQLAERTPPGLAVFEGSDARAAFPVRAATAHKGTFGHVLVVAGSPGKTGAATMTALAALRSGAGLVTVAVPESLNPILETKLTEAMTAPLPETDTHCLGWAALEPLERLAEGKSAIAIGPGLGGHAETRRLVQELVQRLTLPIVIDADGLNALAGDLDRVAGGPGARVLTPHPGECARLLGVDTATIVRDRLRVARETAATTGSVLVLKMAGTLVGDPEGRVTVNPTGNPGMATGGTGDVLTGVIAALLAQGAPAALAARAGAFVHGRAGDLAAARLGQEALLAGDVLEALSPAIRSVLGEGDARA